LFNYLLTYLFTHLPIWLIQGANPTMAPIQFDYGLWPPSQKK